MRLIERPLQRTQIESEQRQLAVSGQSQIDRKAQIVLLVQVKAKAGDSSGGAEINAHVVPDHPSQSSCQASLNIGNRHFENEWRIRPLDNDANFAKESCARLSAQQACKGQIKSAGDLAAKCQWVKRNRDGMRIERPHLEPKFRDDAEVQPQFAINLYPWSNGYGTGKEWNIRANLRNIHLDRVRVEYVHGRNSDGQQVIDV